MAYDWEKFKKDAMGTLDEMLGYTAEPSRKPLDLNMSPTKPAPIGQAAPNIFETNRATPQDYAHMNSKIPDMGQIARGTFGQPQPFKDPITGAILEKGTHGEGIAKLPDGQMFGNPMALRSIPGATETYVAPGGGTATVPQGTFAQTPQQRQNKEEMRVALGLPEGTDPAAANEQQRKIDEAKASIGARQIIKSLRESNMSDEDIKREIGFTPGMSKVEAFNSLKRLAKGESSATPDSKLRTKRMERIGQKAERADDGTPANAAAAAQDYEAYLNQPSADPLNDKSNRDYMNPSQKREYDRFVERVAYGKTDDKQKERVAKIMVDVDRKRQNESELIKATSAKKTIRAGIKEAKNKADGKAEEAWYKGKNTQIGALERKKESGTWTDKDQTTLDGLYDEVVGGYQVAEPTDGQGAPEVTTQQQYDALPSGAEYMEDGVKYRKP